MQINIPTDADAFVLGKAAAAGYADVSEYVIRLIENDRTQPKPTVGAALRQLRELRAEVPKMTRQEIVDLVAEGRQRCAE